LKTNIVQAYKAYKELFQTGGISSTAEGDKVLLDVRGNFTGDIVIFISPKRKSESGKPDTMELVRTDGKLDIQRHVVLESLKQKFLGLTLLPKSLIWLINIIIVYYTFFRLHFNSIFEMIKMGNYPTNVLSYLPFILPLLTLVFGKFMGFKVLKPILSTIVWIVRQVRHFRNRKVKDMEPIQNEPA
jgi:hypothetical protein